MAVSDFALVSLSDTKSYLGLTGDNTNRDSWLEGEINRTTHRLEAWLHRKVKARFYREDVSENYNDNTLYLKNTPIIEVQNIYRDKDRDFDSDAIVDVDTYQVYQDYIELPYSGYYGYYYGLYDYSRILRTIRIEYVAGWGVLEIPYNRQRLDLTEESGGDTLTFYLDAGEYTPTEIVELLNVELNTQGDNERVVTFDWRTRQFTITQDDGDLGLLPSDTGFTEDDSVLPLLGFTGSGHTSSPATGDAIDVDIPQDLKGAVLELIAMRYDSNSNGEGRRGLSSRTIGNYSETFTTGGTATQASMEYPADIESILTQYRQWEYI